MGEGLTRVFGDDALGTSAATVATNSTGAHAVVGEGMKPSSALVLSGLGGDPTGFRVRQLTADMAIAADFTRTMTRRHRREALKRAPRAMFRTYTLREAADLLGSVDLAPLPLVGTLDVRARALVAALGAQRATRRRTDRGADDVFDLLPCSRPSAVPVPGSERRAAPSAAEFRPTAGPEEPENACEAVGCGWPAPVIAASTGRSGATFRQ
jgi:protein-tyrosine-phosphatase